MLASFIEWSWLIPALPLVGFLVNGLLGRRMSKPAIAAVACGAVIVPFIVSAVLAFHLLRGPLDGQTVAALEEAGIAVHAGGHAVELTLWDWISGGPRHGVGPEGDGAVRFLAELDIPLGFYLDPLAAVMLLVITGVGSLIHVYATSYMEGEDGYWRFFAYLNLFVSMMTILVMGSSFLVAFIGWEGVGLCSYLLIGFYYKQDFPAFAGMKAFVVNRIGDMGFILGMLLLLLTFGSLQYAEVLPRAAGSATYAGSGLACAIALLFFVGAVGKSAQLPLSVWLPDAMAGPTPVSALIHAATMVTAGVYLVIRANILFQASPTASLTVAVVGVVTAFWAASIALVQHDIKKVLAYSTVSQLGYMFLAVGIGAYSAGLFHLVTHAFFKALLFLGAGSVSHGLHGELDMRRMGGLRDVMPTTRKVMFIGTLAIAGVPLLAGFFSKDEILVGVVAAHYFGAGTRWLLWGAAVVTALLTSFYMFRLYYLTFEGKPRWAAELQPHESPGRMTKPLWLLAGLSVVGGTLGLGAWTHVPNWLHGALAPVIWREGTLVAASTHPRLGLEVLLVVVATGVALAGWRLARGWYHAENDAPARLASSWSGTHAALLGKYRLDEAYDALVVRPLVRVSEWAGGFDRWVVDGLVEAAGIGATLTGEVFRHFSSGRVRTYALAVFIGAVGIACWLLVQ